MMRSLKKMTRRLCTMSTDEVFDYVVTKHKFYRHYDEVSGRRFAYRPGKNPDSVMLVCHADTVLGATNVYHETRNVVHSPELDDRLGIACMLAFGNPLSSCAMLICDDEERGQSTADLFPSVFPNAKPNWLVELDRRGTDAVTYDYGNETWHSLLESVGFDIGHGSFSDICYLDSLGVCGVNVGIGYDCEHTNNCHADLRDTISQIEKLQSLLNSFGKIRLRHDIQTRDSWYSVSSYNVSGKRSDSYSAYNDGFTNFKPLMYCEDCQAEIADGDTLYYEQADLCRNCFDRWAIFDELSNS